MKGRMRVSVDSKICCGHGRCYALCPEIFLEDDEGYVDLKPSSVPPGLEAQVRRAAENCPELAIKIEE